MASLIGNKPNQVPTNGDLGKLAFMDTLDSFTSKTLMDTDTTNVAPSLNLDFANSKVLDPRITFTRSTTGSYYDGKSSAVAEQNLVTYSQDYTNAVWSKANITVTANAVTAPDGTTTGSTLTATGTAVGHVVYQTTATTTQTWSCYAQAGTNNFIQIRSSTDANTYANFVITAGSPSVGNVGLNATASIVSVGNNWYRCILTCNVSVNTIVFQIVSSGTAVWNESNSLATTVNLWGAQVEQRSAATAYTPTTTTAITNYIPTLQTAAAGVARFDHNPTTGESLGLLIEESRANLNTYSSAFDNAAWTKSATSITASANIAPDGTQTAQKLVEDTSTGAHSLYQANSSFTASTVTSASIYAKAGERTWFLFSFANDSNLGAWFNLSSGTVGTRQPNNTSASITPVGNGWYRCTITFSPTKINPYFGLSLGTADSTSSYTGNGYAGIYIWGSQAELGAFATSYIPTVASQVTRSADLAVMTGTNFSSWFNISQGTFYGDALPISITNTNSKVLGTTPVSVGSYMSMSSNGSGGGNGWYATGLSTLGTALPENKTALVYNSSTSYFAGSMNGGAIVSSTASDFKGTSTAINIGVANAGYINGWIKKLTYYPIALSSAELQEITA